MQGRDRLQELLGNVAVVKQDDVMVDVREPRQQRQHTAKYEAIRASLVVIRSHTAGVIAGIDRESKAADNRKRTIISHQVEALMVEANQHAKQIKLTLEACKAANTSDMAKVPPDESPSTMLRIRMNEYMLHLRQFHDCMAQYNQAASGFKKHLEKRTRRELQIVASDLPEERVEEIVSSGKASEYIQALIVSDHLKTTVAAIEERHLEIMQLERHVLDLFEMFRDLATLVDLQQESMDVITQHIGKAKRHVEEGEVDLQKAEEYQTKSRKLKCCCLLICLGVLTAVLTPTLLTTVGRS